MNKEYALYILEEVECNMLEYNCSLAKEAYRYLYNLKSVQKDNELMDRIYSAKYSTRRNRGY